MAKMMMKIPPIEDIEEAEGPGPEPDPEELPAEAAELPGIKIKMNERLIRINTSNILFFLSYQTNSCLLTLSLVNHGRKEDGNEEKKSKKTNAAPKTNPTRRSG